MDILLDSVKRLEEILACSGCEEGGIRLDVDPDAKTCQYERGACMTASFGGRTAEYVTDTPIRAMTKISFMFGAPLDNSATRGAACAIINVAMAFFCLTRVRRSCKVTSHAACLKELAVQLEGHRIFSADALPVLHRLRGVHFTEDIREADIILVNNEGIITPDLGDLIAAHGAGKRILWLGPSTAGVCQIQQGEHWCPYGQALPESIPDPSRQNG